MIAFPYAILWLVLLIVIIVQGSLGHSKAALTASIWLLSFAVIAAVHALRLSHPEASLRPGGRPKSRRARASGPAEGRGAGTLECDGHGKWLRARPSFPRLSAAYNCVDHSIPPQFIHPDQRPPSAYASRNWLCGPGRYRLCLPQPSPECLYSGCIRAMVQHFGQSGNHCLLRFGYPRPILSISRHPGKTAKNSSSDPPGLQTGGTGHTGPPPVHPGCLRSPQSLDQDH